MQLLQYPQQGGSALVQSIIELEATAWPTEGESESFPSAPQTYVTSFVMLEGSKAVCHAAVRRAPLIHKGVEYTACGLSEVVTRPGYQGRGIASQVIARARDFILNQGTDIGIFTCRPELVSFYARSGWTPAEGSCLIGGTPADPFRSDSLGLVTMLSLLSDKARLHWRDFESADIFCELGKGQLW